MYYAPYQKGCIKVFDSLVHSRIQCFARDFRHFDASKNSLHVFRKTPGTKIKRREKKKKKPLCTSGNASHDRGQSTQTCTHDSERGRGKLTKARQSFLVWPSIEEIGANVANLFSNSILAVPGPALELMHWNGFLCYRTRKCYCD